jgi:hypothetical protein
MKFVRPALSLAILFLFLAALTALAGPIGNYDPSLPAPAPIMNAGWAYDQVNGRGIPSVDSPYIYNLPVAAILRITDDFVQGDVYTVTDFAVPILVTAVWAAMPPLGGPGPDPFGWLNAGYAKGWIILPPGPHLLSVSGNGAGGIPAGFFTRIDMVPEPSTFVLLSVGLGALGLLRRRKSL